IARGESMALVGESGSGKSTVGLAIMGLLEGQAKVTAKSIELGGTELTGLSREAMRAVRGRRMAMVFQDPFQSLNPALTIGTQVAEPLRYHGTEDSGEIR